MREYTKKKPAYTTCYQAIKLSDYQTNENELTPSSNQA